MLYRAQAELHALIAEAEAETIESHLVLPQPECNTTVVCCIAGEATPNEDQCLIHSEERERLQKCTITLGFEWEKRSSSCIPSSYLWLPVLS